MQMYMNVLDEALNGSEARDQALKEKFIKEANAPENTEAGRLSQQSGRLLKSVGTGLVVLGERLQRNRPDFEIVRANTYSQETT